MQRIEIKSIKNTGRKSKVFDLSVSKNKNFFIGNSEILTKNCDAQTPESQNSLRHIIEAFSSHTRFIFTCNHIEKIIDPIISRCQVYELIPPSKKEIAMRMMQILKNENIQFDIKNVAFVVDKEYPDIRHTINFLQKYSINGKLEFNQEQIINSDFRLKLIESLKKSKSLSVEKLFIDIRQNLADSEIGDFDGIYKLLYDKIDDYAINNIPEIILTIAEYEYRSVFTVDKEINLMACIVEILNKLKQT